MTHHPYAGHLERHVEKRRVKHIMKHAAHHAKGGAVHGDEAEDRKLVKSMLKAHDEHKVEGHKGKHRQDKFARGGRTKHHTTVNVNLPPHKQPVPVPVPVPAGGPAGAAPGGPPGMPPGMPPPGGPPGLPPGMPMRARGGKVDGKDDFIPGESNPENLRRWQDYASRNSFSTGGATHKYPHYQYGASTGMGRLEETKEQRKERGK